MIIGYIFTHSKVKAARVIMDLVYDVSNLDSKYYLSLVESLYSYVHNYIPNIIHLCSNLDLYIRHFKKMQIDEFTGLSQCRFYPSVPILIKI